MNSAVSVSGWVVLSGFALVAPGLAWADVLGVGRNAGWPERLVLAAGLSAVLMPLVTFWLSLAGGMPVDWVSVTLVAAGLTMIPVIYRVWRRSTFPPGGRE